MGEWHFLDDVENEDGTLGADLWFQDGRVYDAPPEEGGQELELTDESDQEWDLKVLRSEGKPIDDELAGVVLDLAESTGDSVRTAYERLRPTERHTRTTTQGREDYVRFPGEVPSGQVGGQNATVIPREQRIKDAAQVMEQDAELRLEHRRSQIEDGEF